MNLEELEPCPFCGSTDLKVGTVWKEYRFVACRKCKAAGPVVKLGDPFATQDATDVAAGTLWNQAPRAITKEKSCKK